ncbi:hypothetical protein AV530_010544 [Patagioenas fasciata monilis]|uniref:Uncharacterized protein n=1 Tax=Patagioenas fasciata monilis TaxID=372326 RepID=A0A1V4KFE5_PATFA|nr:hypothetical protein AV530_010544 [Patagioenas fasciata monilis]
MTRLIHQKRTMAFLALYIPVDLCRIHCSGVFYLLNTKRSGSSKRKPLCKDSELRLAARQIRSCDFTHKDCGSFRT